METGLLNYFILNEELKNTCDFNPVILQNGRGIYEVFRVIDGVPLFLEEHVERFYHSVELGNFACDVSFSQLKSRMRTLLESNRLMHGNVQFHLIEHPDAGSTFMSWVSPHRYPTHDEFKNGVELLSLHAVRNNPHLKSTNLPARLMANELLDKEEVYEVMLIDDNHVITEGSRSNIFFIKDERIVTPSLSLVLDGITRSKVISIAMENQLDMHTTLIPFDNIDQFDAAFLTSTSMKILPISKVDDHIFATDNPMMLKLMELFEAGIRQNLEQFSWE
jgi:branched-chain amino acid aminotransferase